MNEQSEEEIRSIWRRSWLNSMHDFTSIEEQELLWLARKPGQMSTYTECMCGYFDDALHGRSLESFRDQGYLTQAEVEACCEFHQLAKSYCPPKGYDRDDRPILADPAWHSVVSAAQDAWKRLRFKVESDDERAYMDRLDAA